ILLKRKGIQASQRWIRFRSDAKRIEQLTFDKEDHNAITELFLKGNNKHLSFIDISLIFLATNNNQVYTFDNKLQNALSS
ncbi:MAG: hypothetical protein U1C97_01265, partial [Candidatus Gracilibacteria bacterium]|nr:hypothetical protein [Candidatus Gracilibacteria bacterium]